MSKIASSYKIIKNEHVTCDEKDVSLIKTKIVHNREASIQKNLLDEDKETSEESKEVDIAAIRQELHQEILQELQGERQKIIEEAKILAEEIKREAQKVAYKLGIKKGYEQGIKEAKEEASCIKNNAVHLLEQAQNQVNEYFIESRADIIKLACDMAESIVHTKINASSENVVMLIKPILQEYGKMKNIIITCHPNNSAYIKGNLYQLETLSPEAKFVILEDANLEENGCIIENEHQIIDLQIGKQIKSILDDMKNME